METIGRGSSSTEGGGYSQGTTGGSITGGSSVITGGGSSSSGVGSSSQGVAQLSIPVSYAISPSFILQINRPSSTLNRIDPIIGRETFLNYRNS